MKNYFDFQLKGKDLLSLWLIFYVLYLIPYVFWTIRIQSIKNVHGNPSAWVILLFLPLILVALIWSFYFIRKVLGNIWFRDDLIRCDFNLGKYLGMILSGLFLSIITFGIYIPWFIRNYHRFFINNSSWKNSKFAFLGEGQKLFAISLLYGVIPVFIISIILTAAFGKEQFLHPSGSNVFIKQLLMKIILIPYVYMAYKWAVNVSYKEYTITWHTEFWPSVWKIFTQFFLTIITVGIYAPMAFLKLFAYFANRTKSNMVDNQQIAFGFDPGDWNDFLFLWGQTLLTILTVGIYYPWAFCNVGKRILKKTFMEKI